MKTCAILFALALLSFGAEAAAQDGGTIRGIVSLNSSDVALHNASVRIDELGRVTDTAEDGTYEFRNLAPGTYTVVATMPAMDSVSQTVTLGAGETVISNFALTLSRVQSEITVTASGREELTLNAFQTVTSLDALELGQRPAASLGEALDNQPGIAKRSFGPGSSRPVIRGFDGDRVLILQDGAPAGGLGFQSGDHAEPVNTSTLERVEVLKGPATLLYGPNAIGGVVNAITPETNIHEHPHQGLQGFASTFAGSNNDQAGGSLSLDYGFGDWRVFGHGGAQRTAAYRSREGEVPNTQTRMGNGSFGFGRSTDSNFFAATAGYDDGLYGVAGGDAAIDFRRYNFRTGGGIKREKGVIRAFRATAAYTDWKHAEIEDRLIGTTLSNRQFTFRGVFEQAEEGSLSGSFGFSGAFRRYSATGEETLTPPTRQSSVAGFILEEVDTGRARVQLGGRFDHVRYLPDGSRKRTFNGLSAGAGIHVDLWEGGAFVANFTSSYRPPALEELYNNGPHPGNLAFEIGNDTLGNERSNGIEFSLRHRSSRVHVEQTLFYYGIHDFVYLAPTGAIDDGLNVFRYAQSKARFTGGETTFNVGVHPNVWLNLGLDTVSARLTDLDSALPRIPPVRGHGGLDIRYKGLSVRPEVRLAGRQDDTFQFEEPTAGYAVFNLSGSYSIPRNHAIHILSANFFNIGDRLYRNHLSFVKQQAPEIGRGLNVSYSVRFF